jgi:lipopolysaccharide export system protein LptA
MPLPIYRLRRLLGATALTLTLAVAGMYFYARMRVQDVRKNVAKLPYNLSQTADGFQFSDSDGKRTQFRIQARDFKEFKLNGDVELHKVKIVLYGRDSSRFDRITGDDFVFNQRTGDVIAKGEVQIDLVGNPAGLNSPDQSAPQELKNPIHLKTRDLVFNKNSGDAATEARVEFQTAQASGWAMGAKYAGKSNVLTLLSQIHVTVNGPDASVIRAEHGVITSDPRLIVLDRPHLDRESASMQSDRGVFYLDRENHVERIVATGNVTTEARMVKSGASHTAPRGQGSASQDGAQSDIHGRADQAEFLFRGTEDLLHTATFSGNVHFEQTGTQPMEGEAGRVIADFGGRNEVQNIHAVDGARLTQKAAAQSARPAQKGTGGAPQDFELTAPVIDFTVANGRLLKHAETSGAAQILITQPQAGAEKGPHPSTQKTVVTAGKFDADFAASDGRNMLSTIHGAPDARVVNSAPGQPERVSTSDFIEAIFLPQGGIDSITQKGRVVYTDSETPEKRTQAWASTARYTPSDQMLLLTGSPRVLNGGTSTTANSIRINRESGDAFAEGDVKSSYSELKEQPNGALLASSSPIHVTARTMTANRNSGVALYQGNARLWQDANVVEAPSIQFDRNRRFLTAQGNSARPVETILIQKQKEGAASDGAQPAQKPGLGGSSPIAITAMKLTYADSERKAHYEGGVVARGSDFTANANTADAYLVARSQSSESQGVVTGPSQLDHMVAQGNVLVQQPSRRAQGEKLVYTSADDRFVMTGGPPSIFDAERGKITGVSLTFFRRDDRVLVEGEASTPVVTQTRVAR